MIENYKCKFKSHGKFIFVPSSVSDKKAERLIAFGASIELPDYFFHYRPGGHVDALHRHLESRHFFRVDLKNFFYSIGRNRISRLLRQHHFPGNARTYAEWSTVRNPYPDGPRYVLPIGFRQSPLLASLALYDCAVASAIEDARTRNVFVSVYFDDLIGSSNEIEDLRITYDGILAACIQANLVANPEKLISPSDAIVAFNCSLTHGRVQVTDERIQRFVDEDRGPNSEDAFLDYCVRVEERNHAA
ncbi:MAG: reverse transcriptase domain-containing protein [Xanthobacteraceae bacterium]